MGSFNKVIKPSITRHKKKIKGIEGHKNSYILRRRGYQRERKNVNEESVYICPSEKGY